MKHWLLLVALMGPAIAGAEEARTMGGSPLIEIQVQRLSQELRCLVCQNQTLADSTAPLAEDLRGEIREMAVKGMNDEQITQYLVARYGDFVRYRPPFKDSTLVLWLAPFFLLALGLAGLIALLRQRQHQLAEVPLSKEDLYKVSKLLNKES